MPVCPRPRRLPYLVDRPAPGRAGVKPMANEWTRRHPIVLRRRDGAFVDFFKSEEAARAYLAARGLRVEDYEIRKHNQG